MENKLRRAIRIKKTFLIKQLSEKKEVKPDGQRLDEMTLTELEREYKHQIGK